MYNRNIIKLKKEVIYTVGCMRTTWKHAAVMVMLKPG